MALFHLDEAAAALGRSGSVTPSVVGADNPLALLSEAQDICRPQGKVFDEPIRTLHHLSCTGGTVIAKCIASMANVLLLNEIDYSSTISRKRKGPLFTPTDLISLLHQSEAGDEPGLIEQIFIADISLLHAEQSKKGGALVLRDHSHSHFLVDDVSPERPTLLELTRGHCPVRPIVTVRDPVDSFASMVLHGWHRHFTPSTFDEYCRRQLLFLDRHADAPIVKYEDFVDKPTVVMKKVCKLLALDFYAGFMDVFDSFHFSGDSGRGGSVIERRERRKFDPSYETEIANSEYYAALCERLGYERYE